MSKHVLILILACAALSAVSCTSVVRSSAHVRETVAIALKVTDAGSGEPVPAVVVNVREGRLGSTGAGVTDQKGDYSFVKSYFARSLTERGCPRYLVLELWKEGYRGLVVYIRSEDFMHSATEARLFKDLSVKLKPGRGRDSLDLTKPKPEQSFE